MNDGEKIDSFQRENCLILRRELLQPNRKGFDQGENGLDQREINQSQRENSLKRIENRLDQGENEQVSKRECVSHVRKIV